MDRRAKKIEKARKRRELVKKQQRVKALTIEREGGPLVKSGARAPFGPCWLSVGWDDEQEPQLVSAVVTRRLGNGLLLPASALVDRTCLGVKDGFVDEPLLPTAVDDFLDRFAEVHGGMVECEVLVVQSVVFHAIDYARRLGFEPHRDFAEALFGPRPPVLQHTAWDAPERPLYMPGPHDNVAAITARLIETKGEEGFDVLGMYPFDDEDADDDEV